MRKLQVFILENCPYCKQAKQLLSQIDSIDVEYIDESIEVDRANQHDYYYVPSFYLDHCKIHEGPIDKIQLEVLLNQINK